MNLLDDLDGRVCLVLERDLSNLCSLDKHSLEVVQDADADGPDGRDSLGDERGVVADRLVDKQQVDRTDRRLGKHLDQPRRAPMVPRVVRRRVRAVVRRGAVRGRAVRRAVVLVVVVTVATVNLIRLLGLVVLVLVLVAVRLVVRRMDRHVGCGDDRETSEGERVQERRSALRRPRLGRPIETRRPTLDGSDRRAQDELPGHVERADNVSGGKNNLALVSVQVLLGNKGERWISQPADVVFGCAAISNCARARTLMAIDLSGDGLSENLSNLNPLRSMAGIESDSPCAVSETGRPCDRDPGSVTVTTYDESEPACTSNKHEGIVSSGRPDR